MADSAFVYFDLAHHPDIAALQGFVQRFSGPGNYEDPATFHITALYINSISDHDLIELLEWSQDVGFSPFTVSANRLDVFETDDGRALHIVIEPNDLLIAAQAALHHRFVSAGYGDELSPFSDPTRYKPHVTLVYLPEDAPVPDVTFDLEFDVSKLVFARDEYEAVGTVRAKGFAMDGNDKEKMVWRPKQDEVNYTPLSSNANELCSSCRWFTGANEGGPYCHLIDNFPQDIVASGRCDRWEAIPELKPNLDPLPVVIVDEDEIERALEKPDVQKALLEAIRDARDGDGDADAEGPEAPDKPADKAHEHPQTIYAAPTSNGRNLVQKTLDRFRTGLKPGVSVMKDAAGRRMMFIVTSNSYQDRHKQWITRDALTDDVKRHWTANDDSFIGGIDHLFWHWKELGPVGEIVFSDVWGPFLVELSREINDPISKAFYDFVENHPEIEWGASHNFLAFKSEDVPGGTFTRIKRRESTTLPREDAANLLTFTGVLPMASKRQEYLNQMIQEAYGIEDASDLLEKGLDALKDQIAKTGIKHKAADTEEDSSSETFGPLVLKMAEDLAAFAEALDEVRASITGVTEKQKSLEEAAIGDLRKQVDEVAGNVKGILDELKLTPKSARQEKGTDTVTLDGETFTVEQLKQRLPDKGGTDPFFGDMDVPLSN